MELSWNAVPITFACLSVFISCYVGGVSQHVTSLIAAIALYALDRSRYMKYQHHKIMYQTAATIVLGVAAIWNFHITQANASSSISCSLLVSLSFDQSLVLISLGTVLVGTGMSIVISSRDRFFMQVDKDKRTQLLMAELGTKTTLAALLNKRKSERRIQYKAKYSHLHFVHIGSVLLTATIVAVRLLLNRAQLGIQSISPWSYFVGTSLLTLILVWGSFWYIFRLLTFWTFHEWYRWCTSLLLCTSIVVPHYIDVLLATHTTTEKGEIQGINAAQAALNISTFSLLLVLSVLLILTQIELSKAHQQFNPNSVVPSSGGRKSSKAPSKTSIFSSTRSLRSGRSLFLGTQRSTRVITLK